MNASELFKAGQLGAAIDAQIEEVKAHPADPSRRVFLFELAAFAGDLERAERQIEAVNYEEVERVAAVDSYRQLVNSERLRRRLFEQSLKPTFVVDPPEHVTWRLEAVNRLREHRPAEAKELLDRANQAIPPLHGTLNGKTFDGLRDQDDLFGSVLEVMVQGEYHWVPLEQIDALVMHPPQFPRDLLWAPARIAISNVASGQVFIPALYPGSHQHEDDQVKLGRMTVWNEHDNAPASGVGQRTFWVGDDEIGLLEWRNLQLNE